MRSGRAGITSTWEAVESWVLESGVQAMDRETVLGWLRELHLQSAPVESGPGIAWHLLVIPPQEGDVAGNIFCSLEHPHTTTVWLGMNTGSAARRASYAIEDGPRTRYLEEIVAVMKRSFESNGVIWRAIEDPQGPDGGRAPIQYQCWLSIPDNQMSRDALRRALYLLWAVINEIAVILVRHLGRPDEWGPKEGGDDFGGLFTHHLGWTKVESLLNELGYETRILCDPDAAVHWEIKATHPLQPGFKLGAQNAVGNQESAVRIIVRTEFEDAASAKRAYETLSTAEQAAFGEEIESIATDAGLEFVDIVDAAPGLIIDYGVIGELNEASLDRYNREELIERVKRTARDIAACHTRWLGLIVLRLETAGAKSKVTSLLGQLGYPVLVENSGIGVLWSLRFAYPAGAATTMSMHCLVENPSAVDITYLGGVGAAEATAFRNMSDQEQTAVRTLFGTLPRPPCEMDLQINDNNGRLGIRAKSSQGVVGLGAEWLSTVIRAVYDMARNASALFHRHVGSRGTE